MAKVFSIRTTLQGELLDYLKSSGFDCFRTTELVRDMTCCLASYREENVRLFPDVFVLPSVETVTSLAPGTQRIVLGNVALTSGAETVLKNAAGLAVRGWAVYIVKTEDDRAEYGVFRSQLHSYAVGAEETMKEAPDQSPSILIRNRGKLVVELRNARNETFTAAFTSAPASESAFAAHVNTFTSAIVSTVPEDQRARIQPYLLRLLVEVLQHCHGTLLAAYAPPENGQIPDELKDGVWFRIPLDFAAAHKTAIEADNAQALASLQALESLLAGIIASDGVVVFGTNATVLGYRIFLRPTDEEKRDMPDKGGGRRRTYSLMTSRLGVAMKAALFRSEDGETECQKMT